MRSLRLQLTLTVALVIGATLLLAGSWLGARLHQGMEQSAVARLTESAEHVAAFLPFELPDNWSQGEFAQPYSGHYWELIQLGDGEDAGRFAASASLTDYELLGADAAVPPTVVVGQLARLTGPLEQQLVAVWVPLPVGPEPGRFAMLIAVPAQPLDQQTATLRSALWRGGIVIWLLCVLAGGAAIAAASRPIRALQRQLLSLQRGQRQRLGEAVPSEFSGLVRSFNAVLTAHEQTVARHRDAVAQLAHELKTPLATLRQAAEAGSQVSSEEVLMRVERMMPLIEQEIGRARIHGPSPGLQPVTLVRQLQRAIQVCRVDHELGPDAIRQDVPATLTVPLEARDLYTVIWNLLDNAMRHGGLPVLISATGDGFAIHDSGGGAQLAAIRPQGIGLSLVETILDAYGWTTTISASPEGGRCVTVHPQVATPN